MSIGYAWNVLNDLIWFNNDNASKKIENNESTTTLKNKTKLKAVRYK